MKQRLTWWIEGQPFNNTFSTLTEVIDDIKKIVKENEDFDFNKKIFIGNTFAFNYREAAKDCFDLMKDRFEEIYDDWQSGLDDDKVWWEKEYELDAHIIEIIEDYFIKTADFSVKEKAKPLYQYNLENDELKTLCL